MAVVHGPFQIAGGNRREREREGARGGKREREGQREGERDGGYVG